MSRILGDALVGGPEAESAPEYVTVRITRGQAEALSKSMDILVDRLLSDGFFKEAEYGQSALSALRSQIGGPR